jgi:hypothetical protein
MSMAERLSFERQVAAFLGSMADDVPLGSRTPPRPMLRRARVQMTRSVIAGALIVTVAMVLGTVLARGLIGGDGLFHGHRPNSGSTVSSDGSNPGVTVGSGATGVGVGAIGDPGGALGRGLFGDVDGPYGPYGRLSGRRGPDGGSWGGVSPRNGGRGSEGFGGPGGSGGSPGSKERGGAGEVGGGAGWEPPPIWVGGVAGSPLGTDDSSFGGPAMAQTGDPEFADAHAAHAPHHRRASKDA